jgi:signal peptidase II
MSVNSTRKTALVLVILLLCIGLDQGTKSLARKNLVQGQRVSYFHDTFRLQLTKNSGAFLGMGTSLPDQLRFTIFTLLVAGILLAGLGYLLLLFQGDQRFIPGAALVLGGGISNLADRILYEGRVIDFMNVGLGSLRTGIFNVADMNIMAGTCLVLFFLFRSRMRGVHPL